MRYFITLLIVWGGFIASTQAQKTIPQLQKEWRTAATDTARIRIANEVATHYEQINVDSCLYFLDQSLKIAQKSGNNYATAHAMYRLGWVHLYLTKDESKALEWTNKGIGFAKPLKDYLHLAKYLGSQTVIAQHQGIGNAEELGKLSVSYAKQSNDWQTIVTSYGILGNVYVASKNYIMAEETTAKLMDLVKERDKSHWLTLGIEYLKLLKRNNKPKQANAFRRELAAAKGKMENTQGDWIYLNDMANIEIALENYTEAERLLMLGVDKEKEKAKADTLIYIFSTEASMNYF